MAAAEARGYVTYKELNQAMPPVDYTSEQNKDIVAMFLEKGVDLVDFPDGYAPDEAEPIDRDVACKRGISRVETALAALRRGRVRFACQLLEASLADLRPFADD